jgi:hypothetical protein
MRDRLLNRVLGNWLDRDRFPGLGATSFQTAHRCQRPMNRFGHEFLGDRPLEHSNDASNPLIDDTATEISIDHPLAHGFQL